MRANGKKKLLIGKSRATMNARIPTSMDGNRPPESGTDHTTCTHSSTDGHRPSNTNTSQNQSPGPADRRPDAQHAKETPESRAEGPTWERGTDPDLTRTRVPAAGPATKAPSIASSRMLPHHLKAQACCAHHGWVRLKRRGSSEDASGRRSRQHQPPQTLRLAAWPPVRAAVLVLVRYCLPPCLALCWWVVLLTRASFPPGAGHFWNSATCCGLVGGLFVGG